MALVGEYMAFGDVLSLTSSRCFLRLYQKYVGCLDFHSRLRWHAVKRFVDFGARKTLEVGGGVGLMAFEFAKFANAKGTIVVTDQTEKALKTGKEILRTLGYNNMKFLSQDLRRLSLTEQFDQVLAIDVLEHIDDDMRALRNINRCLREGGLVVISVPTPIYQKYLGRDFADSIGHVRDGYKIEDLRQKLEKSGFVILKFTYHTKFWGAILCAIFYRRWIKMVALPLRLGLLPLLEYSVLFLDKFLPNRGAISLCILAKKVRSLG